MNVRVHVISDTLSFFYDNVLPCDLLLISADQIICSSDVISDIMLTFYIDKMEFIPHLNDIINEFMTMFLLMNVWSAAVCQNVIYLTQFHLCMYSFNIPLTLTNDHSVSRFTMLNAKEKSELL